MNFGDGNAVIGNPSAKQFAWEHASRPKSIKTPSGNNFAPWEHQFPEYDGLGRLKKISHSTGSASIGVGSIPHDDVIDFGYDRFGLMNKYDQTSKGVFPSGCSGSVALSYVSSSR